MAEATGGKAILDFEFRSACKEASATAQVRLCILAGSGSFLVWRGEVGLDRVLGRRDLLRRVNPPVGGSNPLHGQERGLAIEVAWRWRQPPLADAVPDHVAIGWRVVGSCHHKTR